MKMIFFLVALANVAFFMWEFNAGAFEQTIENQDKSAFLSQEGIVLVKELKMPLPDENQIAGVANEHDVEAGSIDKMAAENKSNAANQKEARIDVDAPAEEEFIAGCYEAGPFTDEKLFAEWYKQLTAANADIKLLSKTPRSASDYQVYYPSAATLELSKANLDMLKSQGFNDVWMLSQGDEKGQISLGVFKKEERAQAMRDQLLTKGINVEIKPRYKNRLNRLVLFNAGGSNVSEILQALERTFPGITLKPAANCPEQQSDD